MIDFEYKTLEELNMQLEMLQHEINEQDIWVRISGTEAGMLLIESLKKELEITRTFYTKIKVTSPTAAMELAIVQAAEDKLMQWVNRLENAENFKNQKLEDIQRVMGEITAREKAREELGNSIVAPNPERKK